MAQVRYDGSCLDAQGILEFQLLHEVIATAACSRRRALEEHVRDWVLVNCDPGKRLE